jgi:hypothetical protein
MVAAAAVAVATAALAAGLREDATVRAAGD